jgi:glycosyltransferase involved in cell wall biosynthesis
VSGKEVMALELAIGLRSSGQRIEFVTSSWGNGDFVRRLEAEGLPAHPIRLGFISATLTLAALRMTLHQVCYWPALVTSYLRVLRRAKPDWIVHTTWHHLLLLAPFLTRARDIYWVHEVLPETRRYRKVFAFLEQRLHCFVAVSYAAADSLRALGVAPAKIRVIYNGVADPLAGATLRAAPSDQTRIGIVGQVCEWKGHDDLIDAFSTVRQSHPGVELHIFGRGTAEYEAKLKSRIAALQLSRSVKWRGFVSDRQLIFNELSICVVPSRSNDTLPTTAIEAGMFGVPVIATTRGGLPEIVEHGITGFLVAPQTPAEIATRLNEMIENSQLRATMGERARVAMLSKFGKDRFVKEFREVLRARAA